MLVVFLFTYLLWSVNVVIANIETAKGWVQTRENEVRFNVTQNYLSIHTSMYPDWYESTDQYFNKNPYNEIHEYIPTNFSEIFTNLDPIGICTMLDYAKPDGGILLVGGSETIQFTIQLASLLKAKHCSVTCSSSISCMYCICDGNHKLAYIRNDDLSVDHSYPSGQCNKGTKHKRRLGSVSFCQPWAVKHVLSQFSVILLNQDNGDISTPFKALDALIDNTDKSQILMFKTGYQSMSTCTSNITSTDNVQPLPDRYRLRLTVIDAYSSSLNYAYRHANITTTHGSGLSVGSTAESIDPYDMTKTMPEDGGRRQLKQWRSLHPTVEFPCRPYNIASNPFILSDFLLLWSDLLYTNLLLSYKSLLFEQQPCCSSTSLDIASQQIVTIEFSVLNYMLAYAALDQDLHFSSSNHSNPYDVVILSCSDLAYEEAFKDWFETKDAIIPQHDSSIHSYIIGIDADTCEYLKMFERPYLCFYYSPNFLRSFKTKGVPLRLAIGVSKLVYPLLFLNYGINVLFSEMDIFWRGDPINTDLQSPANWKYDIQVSGHVDFWPRFITLPEELNIGIFYVKATHTSHGLFQDMLRYTCTHPHLMGTIGTWDQKLFDHFIRTDVPSDEKAPAWPEHYVNWQSFITTNESIIWRRMPGELYTHNQGQLIRVFPQTMTVHISWGMNPPSKRIFCASQLGLIPTTKYQLDYANVKCFN